MSDKASPAPARLEAAVPFWRAKTLAEMNAREWESLCDGCGRCCLLKLEDDDTGEVYHTDVGCTLLDGLACNCRDYVNRQRRVPDCVRLTPEAVRTIPWLPPTCAYRRLAEGKGLAWWHPLVSGDPQTVVDVGVSARGRTFAEQDIAPGEWEDHAVDWPEWEPPEQL